MCAQKAASLIAEEPHATARGLVHYLVFIVLLQLRTPGLVAQREIARRRGGTAADARRIAARRNLGERIDQPARGADAARLQVGVRGSSGRDIGVYRFLPVADAP
jgi:hypothetical protein